MNLKATITCVMIMMTMTIMMLMTTHVMIIILKVSKNNSGILDD